MIRRKLALSDIKRVLRYIACAGQSLRDLLRMPISCETEVDGLSGFIFCNRFNQIHNPQSVNRLIKRIREDYNAAEEIKAAKDRREPIIIPPFSNHIARHTFCSRLCEQDINVKVIQAVMGHKDIQTTFDIYTEVTEG